MRLAMAFACLLAATPAGAIVIHLSASRSSYAQILGNPVTTNSTSALGYWAGNASQDAPTYRYQAPYGMQASFIGEDPVRPSDARGQGLDVWLRTLIGQADDPFVALAGASARITFSTDVAVTAVLSGMGSIAFPAPGSAVNVELEGAGGALFAWQTRPGVSGADEYAFEAVLGPGIYTLSVALDTDSRNAGAGAPWNAAHVVLNFEAIPEPATAALLAVGLAASAVGARRR